MDLLDIKYEKYELNNGLEVILYKDSSLPLVSVNIWYKTGSANEQGGKTGLAHLFEHMMFQGSENVPKEMHFKFVQEAGGTLNGSTSFDRTNYYEKVPSNYLELALWLESDRMGFLLPALTEEKLNNQIDVVKNERLERYENQPYGLAWEILISNLYPKGHPYSWPTIGFMDDISSFKLDEVKKFFQTYYSPSNASLVVAGDLDTDKTKRLIEKYFNEIPAYITPKLISSNSFSLKENKIINRKEDVQLNRIYLTWHSTEVFNKYDASLDVLADILTGSKNARLYKNLVYENELAQDISAYQFSGKYGGHFTFIATAKPGIKPEKLKEEILNELENIKENGITERELIRSKNGIESNFIFSLQNIDSMANQLNYYNFYLGEPNSFNFDLSRYDNTDDSLISEAVNTFFNKPFVELNILGKQNND
jgi:zinc protease